MADLTTRSNQGESIVQDFRVHTSEDAPPAPAGVRSSQPVHWIGTSRHSRIVVSTGCLRHRVEPTHVAGAPTRHNRDSRKSIGAEHPVSPINADTAQSVRDEYRTLADSYEQRWRRYLDVSAAHTLDTLDPREGESILDAGCGTGLLLRRVAARAPGAHLVGIDLTLAMIRRADAKLSGLLVGDVCRLPLARESLDAVVLASVLQYLPSLDCALSEIVRVLRPGGRVVITAWGEGRVCMRTLGRWLRWRGKADVHLHPRDDLVASCEDHRLSIRREQTYSVGPLWRLLTVVAVKNVGDGSVRSKREGA
ncbi:MAG: methyltransferase domain-containing protein [Rhodanobacteraceae bacterium]|nr:MAG: methyltransferase domain-containing protein [Rhodanobacteraceae bacterium]